MTGLREFSNRLRIMMSIDQHELVEAGIDSMRDIGAWRSFMGNPYRWLIQADDDSADKLWSVIERRAAGKSFVPPPPSPTTLQKGGMPRFGGGR